MRPLRIVLAEDNEADVLLVRQALREHRVEHELSVVEDGYEALQYVSAIGSSDDFPRPDLLLLDLNLPKVDGVEVLREFRKRPQCGETPVVVLSSSNPERECSQFEDLRISRYFQKPLELDEFMLLGAVVLEVTGRAVR